MTPTTSTAANSAVSVTTSASKIVTASARTGTVSIQPTNGTIYLGSSSSVTTSNGFPIAQGATAEVADFVGDVWAIGGGTVDVRVWRQG
jgi:hypothetical protein